MDATAQKNQHQHRHPHVNHASHAFRGEPQSTATLGQAQGDVPHVAHRPVLPTGARGGAPHAHGAAPPTAIHAPRGGHGQARALARVRPCVRYVGATRHRASRHAQVPGHAIRSRGRYASPWALDARPTRACATSMAPLGRRGHGPHSGHVWVVHPCEWEPPRAPCQSRHGVRHASRPHPRQACDGWVRAELPSPPAPCVPALQSQLRAGGARAPARQDGPSVQGTPAPSSHAQCAGVPFALPLRAPHAQPPRVPASPAPRAVGAPQPRAACGDGAPSCALRVPHAPWPRARPCASGSPF
eukprot:Opistho-2@27324